MMTSKVIAASSAACGTRPRISAKAFPDSCANVFAAVPRAVLEPLFAPTLENEFRILREAVAGTVVVLERLDRHRLAD